MALLSKRELFDYAAELTDVLTDAYVQNRQLKSLANLSLGVADVALNGPKASTPLLGLYQLFKANSPKLVLGNKPELDLAPELRQQALPRPRPY